MGWHTRSCKRGMYSARVEMMGQRYPGSRIEQSLRPAGIMVVPPEGSTFLYVSPVFRADPVMRAGGPPHSVVTALFYSACRQRDQPSPHHRYRRFDATVGRSDPYHSPRAPPGRAASGSRARFQTSGLWPAPASLPAPLTARSGSAKDKRRPAVAVTGSEPPHGPDGRGWLGVDRRVPLSRVYLIRVTRF